MMRRANQPNRKAPPADLLVCFPSTGHLTLIPKKICSPGRVARRQIKRLPSTRLGQSPAVSWDKSKTGSSEGSEPSSPKVTCAGQIKVRPRAGGSCKSWQSVMEEIERIRKTQKKKKKLGWGEALGIKREVMQFLSCLRNVKLDFRCFGGVPECELSSDEEEEEEEDQKSESEREEEGEKRSRAVFSDWFMVLQENEDATKESVGSEKEKGEEGKEVGPPANALLLMRCRSAPAKSWLENRAKVEEEEEEEEGRDEEEEAEEQEKERKKLRDYLVVMEYDKEMCEVSTEVAKETWVVGSVNPFSRSRSWKR